MRAQLAGGSNLRVLHQGAGVSYGREAGAHLVAYKMLLKVCRLEGIILIEYNRAHVAQFKFEVNVEMVRRGERGLELRRVLAENVRAYRCQKKLSQEEFAEICGLHRTYVGSVERAERNVTLNTLEAFATALGVSVPVLLTKRNLADEQ